MLAFRCLLFLLTPLQRFEEALHLNHAPGADGANRPNPGNNANENVQGGDQDRAEDNPERMCDDCEIDYNDEDIARNDFNKVMNELKGQHDGFPINAFGYLILVSVLGFALIGIIIFFCIKIFV